MRIRRRDVVLVDFEPSFGSEQGKIRPAVVIQNDYGNNYSPITIVAPVTSKVFSREFPSNVFVEGGNFGLRLDSTILLNQIRAIDKRRVLKKLGELDLGMIRKVDLAIGVSLGLGNN